MAVVKLRHTGMALCKDHFIRSVEQRVERTISRYGMVDPTATPQAPERWVIAMSGGKDSQALAEVLLKIFPRSGSRVTFVGLYIDVGVLGNGYTDESRECVVETCRRLGIECRVVDLRGQFGFTMDDLHVVSQCKHTGANRTECSSCGIVKRYLINRAAAEAGVAKVATGHHLTDEATNLLGNFLNMNIDQLTRPQPWTRREVGAAGQAGAAGVVSVLLPRVKPFLEITEEETTMYVHFAGLRHVATQCLYSANATSSALKKHMLAIERERPGVMLRLVRGFMKNLQPLLSKEKPKDAAAAAASSATSAAGPADDDEVIGREEDAALEIGAIAAVGPEVLAAAGDIEATVGQGEGEPEIEDAARMKDSLRACDRCKCPTVVPVCAFCKLVEQTTQFKGKFPQLFEQSNPKAHTCLICRPQPKVDAPSAAIVASAAPSASDSTATAAAPAASAAPAPGAPQEIGSTLTLDMSKSVSKKRKKWQQSKGAKAKRQQVEGQAEAPAEPAAPAQQGSAAPQAPAAPSS